MPAIAGRLPCIRQPPLRHGWSTQLSMINGGCPHSRTRTSPQPANVNIPGWSTSADIGLIHIKASWFGRPHRRSSVPVPIVTGRRSVLHTQPRGKGCWGSPPMSRSLRPPQCRYLHALIAWNVQSCAVELLQTVVVATTQRLILVGTRCGVRAHRQRLVLLLADMIHSHGVPKLVRHHALKLISI